MMGELNINRENTLRLFVSSYTDSPTVTELQSVFDVSDAQNITHGNPNLRPTYSHRLNFHYVNSNVEKGRTFMWMFSARTTQDYTATHLVQSTSSNPINIQIDDKLYTPELLLDDDEPRRLLAVAHAPELRTSDRVPEVELQRHGGRNLYHDAEHVGRHGECRRQHHGR